MANVSSIGLESLAYYLQRIRAFIEGGKKTLSFPHISDELHEVLSRIVRETDTNFLHTEEYNDNVKMEAARLTAALQATANLKLMQEYQNGELGDKVLTYRKTEVSTFKPFEPLRKPSEVQSMVLDDSSECLVNPTFKARCLNSTNKFVKDDSQLVMRYPDMEQEQAEFLMTMLMQGKEMKSDQMDVGFGYRSMYAPLYESMRLFSLKYEYRIEYDEPCILHAGMKSVIFEKIPKFKAPEKMDVDIPVNPISSLTSLASSSSSIPIRSTKPKASTDQSKALTIKSEAPTIQSKAPTIQSKTPTIQSKAPTIKSEATAIQSKAPTIQSKAPTIKSEAPTIQSKAPTIPSEAPTIQSKVPTIQSKAPTIQSEAPTIQSKAPTTNYNPATSQPGNQSFPSGSKAHKVVKNLKIKMDILPQQFIHDALLRISNFMMNEEEASIVFSDMDLIRMYFLQSVERVSKMDNAYMLFTSQCQKYLGNIKYCAGNRVRYIIKVLNRNRNLHDVIFEKQAEFSEKPVNYNYNQGETQNFELDTSPLSANVQERLHRFRTIIDHIVKTHGEKFIKHALTEINNFLIHSQWVVFEKMTPAQAQFLKYVRLIANMKEAYGMFAEKCQRLLKSINVLAGKYELSFNSELEDKERKIKTISICKKSIRKMNKEVTKRARSLSIGRREKQRIKTGVEAKTERGISAQRAAGASSGGNGAGGGAKAKLLEGLSQPVQSDKAVKMMQSMGWTGGALGPRATGITEPITLPLDLARRAGLGHVPRPPKESKSSSQKDLPKTNAKDLPKVKAKGKLPTLPTQTRFNLYGMPSELLPNGVLPPESLPSHLLPPGIMPSESPAQGSTILLDSRYHETVLRSILKLVTGHRFNTIKFLYCNQKTKAKKVGSFIRHVTSALNSRKPMGLTDLLNELETQILVELNRCSVLRIGFERDNKINTMFFVHKSYVTANNNNTTKNNKNNNNTTYNIETQPIEYIDLTGPVITQISKNSDGTNNVQPLNNKVDANDTPKNNHILKNWINTEKIYNQTDCNAQTGNTANVSSKNAQVIDKNLQSGNTVEVATEKTQVTDKNLNKFTNTDKTDHQIVDNARTGNTVDVTIENAHIKDNNPQSGNIVEVVTDKDPINNIPTGKTAYTVDVTSENIKVTDKTPQSGNTVDNPVTDNVTNQAIDNNINSLITEVGKSILTDIITQGLNLEPNNNSVKNDFQRIADVDKDNVTIEYIMLVGTNVTVERETDNTATQIETKNEPVITDIKTEKTDQNDDSHNTPANLSNDINKCNNNSENIKNSHDNNDELTDYEEDCQIIMNDSGNLIKIDSDEEDCLLNSDVESVTSIKQKPAKIKPNMSQELEKSVIEVANDEENDFNVVRVKTEREESPDINHGSKRRSFDSPVKDQPVKKYKLLSDFKKLCILHKDYPQTKIDNEKAREIQTSILRAIDYTQPQLPLLDCQGIQNGGLIYSCQDEKSLGFMEDLIKTMHDFRIVYEFDAKQKLSHKLAFKMNTLIDEDVSIILNRLELFNSKLKTSNWNIIKKEQYSDFIVTFVEVDTNSFSYVCNANFVLYAGNDCAKFTIIWD